MIYSKREGLTYILLLAAVTLCVSLVQAQNRPNIILIMADDLGYADVGTFGQKSIQTPNLDKMAEEGMKFTQFYTGTPVCAPARCNLMTGMHHGHCRIRGNSENNNLNPEDVTIAEVLDVAGYVSGGFGKWGLGNHDGTGVPYRQGFDEYVGYWDQTHAHNFWTTFLIDDQDTIWLENVNPNEGPRGQGNCPPEGENEYAPTVIANRALDFIDTYKDTTFFMYCPFIIPHLNNEAAGSADAGYEVPDLGIYADSTHWTEPMQSIASMITIMDDNIGKILAKLKEHNIDNNTIVFFTSDNGPTFLRLGPRELPDGTPLSDEERIVAEWFDSNGPYRGYKQDTFEGGIRMPTIARWPGVIEAGSVSEHIGSHPDLLPTLADLAGVSKPTNVDGISMVNALLGDLENQQKHEFLFWKLGQDEAVLRGEWKMVTERVDGNAAEKFLYNIADDPEEMNDLAAENPDIVQELTAIFDRENGDVVVADWDPQLVDPAVVPITRQAFLASAMPVQFRVSGRMLTVWGGSDTELLISINNLSGRQVLSSKLSGDAVFDLRKFSRGIYSLRVKDNKGNHWNKTVPVL